MHSFNIQYHTPSDLADAREKLSPIRPRQLLISVFCGTPEARYITELIGELKTAFPEAAILGTTTAGEIMNGGAFERATVINFTHFEETWVCSGLVTGDADLYRTGRQLAGEIVHADTQVAIIFGCGIKDDGAVNGEPLLTAFHDTFPRVLIAGAQAGDNGLAKRTFVFTQDGFTDSGAAAASLSGTRLIVNNHYNLSWVPLGKEMVVTHAEGTIIHTIDDKPAKTIYTHYLGEQVGDRLPHSAAEFPLMVERHGLHLARHANRVLPDGSLAFMAPFYTGEKVRFAFCHSELVAESARHTQGTFAARPYEVIFVYSCLSRKWVLGKDIELELAPLGCLAPTAGFFSYGEYYSHDQGNLFLSQTMTVLALSEKDTAGKHDERDCQAPLDDSPQESKQIQDLKALHRLVETSAREREQLIEELQSALAEIKTLRG
ncbi:FIST signal transduction protein [Desulfosarcina cetonica]|uniref:FIST signal transduction protein n=1 Tax=Desulfosarcina cetonica TaxID=90730 RepID=UPI0006CF93E2|nr:FIST N-terminal domain-containing protein [Desulfosarcina cetonica]